MEGKSIKEEQSSGIVLSQTAPSKSPPLITATTSTFLSASAPPFSSSGSSSSTIPGSFRSGKENRHVGSHCQNKSSENNKQISSSSTTDILTRSRHQGSAAEESHAALNSHLHHQHYNHRSRNSPNCVGAGSAAAAGDTRIATITSSSPNSPPPANNSSRGGGYSASCVGKDGSLNMSSNRSVSPTPRNGSVTPGGVAVGGGGGGSSGESSGAVGLGITTTRTSSASSNSSNSGTSNVITNGANLRHLLKIKRFLGTLLHFGCEISSNSGERVRNLVYNVVSGHLSIEEFHRSLQEVTSFPLRPFVLPFLRAHLPILQREVNNLARLSKQTPLSYIQSHEQAIIDSGSSPGEPCDIFHSEASEVGGSSGAGLSSGKRKLHDNFYDNGEVDEPSYTSTPKRHHLGAFGNSSGSMFSPPFFLSSSTSSAALAAAEFREHYASATYGYSLYNSANNSGGSTGGGGGDASGLIESHSSGGNHDGIANHSSGANTTSLSGNSNSVPVGGIHMIPKGPEDEWKNIHVMLNCILSMVEKTKRALNILQTRTLQQQQDQGDSGNGSSWLRRPNLYSNIEANEEIKRQTSEMIAHALKATEDRVSEVKRRAEEAVQEVKRQALVEVRRAVASAEARACDAVATERARLERILMETAAATISARRTPGEFSNLLNSEANASAAAAGSDTEACWNCGRKAHETCSGCNMARYCSSFCQHKDWENHHKVCGRNSASGGPTNSTGGSNRSLIVADTFTTTGKQQEQSGKNGTGSLICSKTSSTSSEAKDYSQHHLHQSSRGDNSNSPPCANSNDIEGSGGGRRSRNSPPTEDHSHGST